MLAENLTAWGLWSGHDSSKAWYSSILPQWMFSLQETPLERWEAGHAIVYRHRSRPRSVHMEAHHQRQKQKWHLHQLMQEKKFNANAQEYIFHPPATRRTRTPYWNCTTWTKPCWAASYMASQMNRWWVVSAYKWRCIGNWCSQSLTTVGILLPTVLTAGPDIIFYSIYCSSASLVFYLLFFIQTPRCSNPQIMHASFYYVPA